MKYTKIQDGKPKIYKVEHSTKGVENVRANGEFKEFDSGAQWDIMCGGGYGQVLHITSSRFNLGQRKIRGTFTISRNGEKVAEQPFDAVFAGKGKLQVVIDSTRDGPYDLEFEMTVTVGEEK